MQEDINNKREDTSNKHDESNNIKDIKNIIEEICAEIVSSLTERKQTLSTVESLTGGMLSSYICSIPGASKVFKGGFVTYWEELKKSLCGVSKVTLEKYTVVSKEVAEEMVLGCQKRTDTDYCVSTTGVAGPGSDDYGNPIGKLCFAVKTKEQLVSFEARLDGSTRAENREKACYFALKELLELIKGEHWN